MKLLTGYHIIAANNLLGHLKLWHVTCQYWYSIYYKWPALTQHLATVLYFYSRFNLRKPNFQNFFGDAFRPPIKLGQHSAKPPTSYLKIFAAMVIYKT